MNQTQILQMTNYDNLKKKKKVHAKTHEPAKQPEKRTIEGISSNIFESKNFYSLSFGQRLEAHHP